MIYCISFEQDFVPIAHYLDYRFCIVHHSHVHNMNLDILYGVRNSIVADSGAEHFNTALVF